MDSLRDLLLYVDDEEQALKYFRLTFAKEYEVLTAPDADQGWKQIEQHADRLALIISDQRMPGRSGVELLTAAKERCPRAVRLLTTAYSNLADAIAAVNRGAIFAYVTKPWKIDDLRIVVRQALQLHQLQCERDALLTEKLSSFQRLLFTDRVRTLGIALAGFAGQAQRPLAAAAAWMRDRQDAFAIGDDGGGDGRDLWPMVLAQSRTTAIAASELGLWLTRTRGPETATDLGELLASVAAGFPDSSVVERTSFSQVVDRRLLAAGFSELLALLHSRLRTSAAVAMVQVSGDHGKPIITVRLGGGSGAQVDPDRAGLMAYLAIHHHHGQVRIPSWTAAGGRVEVTLGGSDDDGLEAYLSRLAFCEW